MNRVFIVPMCSATQSRQSRDALEVLSRMRHRPLLGILFSPEEDGHKDTLQFCNEFLCWPSDRMEIDLRIERLASHYEADFTSDSQEEISEEFLSLNIVGSSPPFLQVLRRIKKIARCDAPVMIEGESGTGKELTARAIHYLGPRRDYPFIPVNCGAIPDTLLENELFGHRQGAFTDAKTTQEGLVCNADGGTLFLDEVETFSAKGQVVLLRFLQDRQYKSLGSSTHKQADVRIIAASNARLEELVEQGRFRKDLFYRLNIMSLIMPRLSQRGNDVLELAEHFLNKFRLQYNQPEKRLDQDSRLWLMQYNWPGNVRELENLLHREFLLAETDTIRLDSDGAAMVDRRRRTMDRRENSYLQNNMQEAKAEVVRRFEVEYLTRLLHETEGNVTLAAKKAGKERRSLGKLIKKHGIDKTLQD